MDEVQKVGVEMPYVQSRIHSDCDSVESIADSDLEDEELRKMLASPLYVHGETGSKSANAQRIQADHSRRESLKSNSSQEPRTSGKPDAVFSSRSDELGNQFESFIFLKMLIHQDWEDLFLNVVKIICSIRQDLNLWCKNVTLDLLKVGSMSSSNKLTLKDWNCRTPIMDILNLEENNHAYKKNYPCS